MGKLGLVVPKELAELRKRQTQFKKGDTPVNKGKKQTEYMTPEQIQRTVATRFKKGNEPHNTTTDGQISIRKDTLRDGTVKHYKWIRIGKAEWKMLHVKVWEDEHGTVPDGHIIIIIFKDKNTMNITLDNLECISMAENMQRNSIQRYPGEVKEMIRLTAKLKRKIKKLQDEK